MTSRTRFTGLALLLITLLVPTLATGQRSASHASISSEKIFEAIGAQPGATICEVGAGDGTLTLAAARLAGPTGRVYTNELGERRVQTLQTAVTGSGMTNVTVVAGEAARTNFPDGACDALFLRDVYHHFTDPASMNASMLAALKPGGRAAVIDFTPPNDEAPCPEDRGRDGMHGVKAATVARELKEAGFQPIGDELPPDRWFMVVVSKPR